MKGALGRWLAGALLLAAASGASVDGEAQTPPDLLQAAEAALVSKQYDRAIELYERLRGSYPGAPQIPYNMGVAAYRTGDLKRAAELFNDALLLADDASLRSKSAYNLGTTSFRDALEEPRDRRAATTRSSLRRQRRAGRGGCSFWFNLLTPRAARRSPPSLRPYRRRTRDSYRCRSGRHFRK